MNRLVVLCLIYFYGTSLSVFSSKARLISLGEDKNGSFYINDPRNVFLNPSYINDYTGTLLIEWGEDVDNSTGGSSLADENERPRGEGGYFFSGTQLSYGVYFGSEDDQINTARNEVSAYLPGEDNKFDFFVGGDAGVLWGLGFGYSDTEDRTTGINSDSSTFSTSLGLQSGALSFFTKILLTDEASATNSSSVISEYDSGMNLKIGLSYQFVKNKFYIEAQKREFEFKNAENVETGNGTTEIIDLRLGLGRIININDRAKLYSRGEIVYEDAAEGVGATSEEKFDYIIVPISIGFEYEAKPWLSLRGSITQQVYAQYNLPRGEKTGENTTDVAVGASLVFDDLSLDGLIGTSQECTSTTSCSVQENGTLDDPMTRIAMTYRF